MEEQRDGQTNREIDRQAERQTQMETDRMADRQVDRWTRHTDGPGIHVINHIP